jgi:5-(carboxyamino)imidazole ribonucleotide synthase
VTEPAPSEVLAQPGDAIGILGGGQLGRMLTLAASRLGLDVHVFCPETDSPASRVARKTFVAPFSDHDALREFAASIKVATLEFENIPPDALDVIEAAGVRVRPDARALAISQDRLAEKSFFRDIGIEPAPFARIDTAEQIQPALDQLGGAGILKTRFSGYDGKGQIRLSGVVAADAAFAEVQRGRSILETLIDFECEISVILARSADGDIRSWDPPRNIHEGGILRRSIFPAELAPDLLRQAVGMAQRLATELDYIGVLALELFVTRDGRILANEFAPRVHNSGHWTEDACLTGQFEQHIRAVCGWPLGETRRHSDGDMTNLLGADVHGWSDRLQKGEKVHLYGKRRAADGRKMGHAVRLIRPAGS